MGPRKEEDIKLVGETVQEGKWKGAIINKLKLKQR